MQLSRIQERAKEMHGIIDSLLEYSRIGRNQIRIGSVDVSSVLDSVMLEIATAMPFSMERNGEFPSLKCDGEHIRRVFFELIKNAVQYGGPEPFVRVTSVYREKERVWEFSVVDNGKGIPLPYRDRIFQLFQTLERNSHTGGTGLGLALVKKIIQSVGGKIWVESAGFDGGATFRFTWPIKIDILSLSSSF
jgi:signal transduction histidine kinase